MLHMDEARARAIEAISGVLGGSTQDTRAVLIDDLTGRLRVVLWAPKDAVHDLARRLQESLSHPEAAGPYWTGEVWAASDAGQADRSVYDQAWKEGRELVAGKLRVLDRYRTRGAWVTPTEQPPWMLRARPNGKSPPVVAFYSYKGGVGRSTALAAFAIQRARAGERVAVVDLDLDAPGVGVLLAADIQGTTARWGVVDYLLERPLGAVDFRDYYHACRREAVTGKGEILVIPAGRVDRDYLGKLARVDLEPTPTKPSDHPAYVLLNDVRRQLEPHWLLVDVRAGFADPAGLMLGGFAHLHVLFGTASEQSWAGLKLIIERLGGDRVRRGIQQADCVLVHAMVPSGADLFREATAGFVERSRDVFADVFYAAVDVEDPDRFWTVADAEVSDAPHVPVPLPYNVTLAHFRGIEDVADLLAEDPHYRQLTRRILARFTGGAE